MVKLLNRKSLCHIAENNFLIAVHEEFATAQYIYLI